MKRYVRKSKITNVKLSMSRNVTLSLRLFVMMLSMKLRSLQMILEFPTTAMVSLNLQYVVRFKHKNVPKFQWKNAKKFLGTNVKKYQSKNLFKFQG